MESSGISSSVLTKSSSRNNLINLSNLEADPLSQLELKKKIEDEDRNLSDELLDQILLNDDSDASETFNENISKENSSYVDSRDCGNLQFVNSTKSVELQSKTALKSSLDLTVGNSESDLSKPKSFGLETPAELPVEDYRCPDEEWSADEDTSSSSDSSDSESFFEAMREGPAPKKIMPIKTKGELDLDDLPLIEDLVISVSEQEMEQIGKVYAIVDKLVVVRAFKGLKPLDLDSVLFLSHDNPLGRIFDVFGPVVEPFYSIRFNNDEHIMEKRVTVDAVVYYAPKKNEITSYVFVDQLQNQKGSDASWKDNNEPPEQFLDYSDDEQERAARRKRSDRNRNQNINSSSQVTSKKPHLDDGSSDKLTCIPPPQPAFSRQTPMYHRSNPFMSPHPLVSTPQHFLRSPSPFNLPHNANMAFRGPIPFPPPRAMQMQGSPALVFRAHHQPPVFGQVPFLSPVSPAMHPSPVLTTVQTLVPAHPLPNNYFAQRFSPGPMSPDPWLPNQAPYQQTHSLPPHAPLTVQIPPSSPSLPMQHMNGGGVPAFGPPVFNQQLRTFTNGVRHPPYY